MKILKLLAKNFEYNQALHMETEQIRTLLGVKRSEIQTVLSTLAQSNLVNLYVEKEKIKLAKISWQGLNEIGDINLKYGMGKDSYKNYKAEGYR